MKNAKTISISATEEEQKQIEELSAKLHMTRSEIVREVLDKLYTDKIMQSIIQRKFLQRKGYLLIEDPASHNVRDENEKRGSRPITRTSAPQTLSTENNNKSSEYIPTDEELDEMIRRAEKC